MGQLPSTKAVIYTPTSSVAVKVTLVNTLATDVRLKLWHRLAAYSAAKTGERLILDLNLQASSDGGYTAEKSGIVMMADDELLAEAAAGNAIDFTISGVSG
jgi:hypothetical protein